MKAFNGDSHFYSGDGLGKHFRELIEGSTKVDIASAWISQSNLLKLLVDRASKAEVRLVVGVGKYGTDPAVLKWLGAVPGLELRIHGTAEGPLFHPKLYVFQHQHFRRVLIGSMNLTNAGATENVESMLSLEDRSRTADREFDRHWTALASKPLKEFDLDGYATKRNALLLAAKEASASDLLDRDVKASAGSKLEADGLREGWKTFIREMNQSSNNLEDYRRVLAVRKQLIDRDWSSDLTPDDLNIFFGTAPYYAFGRLGVLRQNQKHFLGDKNRPVRQEIGAALRTALQLRHLERPLVEGLVRRLLKVKYCKAALATRLLVLARPDLFVVVNEKSFEGLQERFGLFVTDDDFDERRYFDLLQKVHEQEWYQSPEPEDPEEREIWKARAAYVDPLVYREKTGG